MYFCPAKGKTSDSLLFGYFISKLISTSDCGFNIVSLSSTRCFNWRTKEFTLGNFAF